MIDQRVRRYQCAGNHDGSPAKSPPRALRRLDVTRTIIGGLYLLAPAALERRLVGHTNSTRSHLPVRVLGLRQIIQAFVTEQWPSRRTLAAGVGCDLLHAASMLAIVAIRRRPRRAILWEAALAALFAVWGARIADARGVPAGLAQHATRRGGSSADD